MSPPSTEKSEKSKVLAFLLAVFLGPLGVHNFFVGRWKRGFTQFGLTFITFGAGLLITIPWAWIEAIGILAGKYSLAPKKQPDKEYGSAKKEYLIATLLLLPLLIISVFFPWFLVCAWFFYGFGGWLWNITTRLFVRLVLPIYAAVFGGGKKFLIRFSEYNIAPTNTWAERFKSTRELSLTAVYVLFFIISLLAQANISMVTEGDIPDAVLCEDGTVDLAGTCDDGSEGTTCGPNCVMEKSETVNRVLAAYATLEIVLVFFFAPFITVIVAPVLVLRFSSLSIVDKKTRSIVPIGQNANNLTKVTAGFGAIVIFFQTALGISLAAAEGGNRLEMLYLLFMIFLMTVTLVVMFYPLIWFPILKFSKSFESHVLNLDNSLVDSRRIEVHQLAYDGNELRITPLEENNQTKSDHLREPFNDQTDHHSSVPRKEFAVNKGPPLDATPDSIDEHGFEWIVHDTEHYYRQANTTAQWVKYHG